MKKIKENIFIASEGKVLSRKADGVIIGESIAIYGDDSIDNYDEIDMPEEYKAKKEEKMKSRFRGRKK